MNQREGSTERSENASLGRVLAPGTLRFERVLPGPLEGVWEFLTDSEKRGTWLASGDMELRPGGTLELRFFHADLTPHKERIPQRFAELENGAVSYGRVTECEAPRLLTFTWSEDDGDYSEVTFELNERELNEGDGNEGDAVVQLQLTHHGLNEPEMLIDVASGWHTHLGILVDRLEGRQPRPFWTTHSRLEEIYRQGLEDVEAGPP